MMSVILIPFNIICEPIILSSLVVFSFDSAKKSLPRRMQYKDEIK